MSSLHSQTFISTELHSIILIPQFPVQFLCPQARMLAGWHLKTQLIRCHFFSLIFDFRLRRLSQLYSQLPEILVIQPRGGPKRKRRFLTTALLRVFTSLLHRNCSSFIVLCVLISAETCLLSRCLAINLYSGSVLPAFRRHVTI
jgi:hypothetical protein